MGRNTPVCKDYTLKGPLIPFVIRDLEWNDVVTWLMWSDLSFSALHVGLLICHGMASLRAWLTKGIHSYLMQVFTP